MLKLPRKHDGSDISIFSEMTALAMQNNAINLAQGFPDYEIDPKLKLFLAEATDKNYNQYAPLAGNPVLIENLKIFNSQRKLPLLLENQEITITAGATYAIYTALATLLHFGDEVLVLEPSYDSYVPAIEVNGGTPVFVSMKDDFSVNWQDLKQKITSKTRAIIINSPHNPSGKIWKAQDFEQLWQCIKDTEIVVISDEVYDLLCYDDVTFYSAFHHPELKQRSFCIFSFGKMFHITGWKIGYILASEYFTTAFRRIHQYLIFSVNAPAQFALAKYLEIFDVKKNSEMMQQKRDFFLDQIQDLPFTVHEKSTGSYFQTVSYEKISDLPDREFSIWLTTEKKVASIPVSAFYHDHRNVGKIRFCFAKKEETIAKAIQYLKEKL